MSVVGKIKDGLLLLLLLFIMCLITIVRDKLLKDISKQ
jgi:hypothetical protein